MPYQRKVEKKIHRMATGIARATAIRLLAAQPERIAMFVQEVEGHVVESAVGHNPHHSHDTTYLANHPNIIWCRTCAAWSLRTKLKKLKTECEGFKNGNKSQLRLLQCGIAPFAGVRMPAHLSRKFCRGRTRRC